MSSEGQFIVVENDNITILRTPAEQTLVVESPGIRGPQGLPGDVGPQGEQGIPGVKGDQGERGLTGAGEGLRSMQQNFAFASTVWTFVHNLNTVALDVIALDSDGVEEKFIGEVSYPDSNTVQVEWYYPEAGILKILY